MEPYSKENIAGWMIYLKTTHHWLSNVLQHIFIYTKSLLGNMRLLKKASHPKLLIKKNATRRFMTVTFRTYSTVTKF